MCERQLTGRSSVLLWVRNRESAWQNWRQGTPQVVTGATLTIAGAPGGRLRVEWLDAWTGRRLRRGTVVASEGAVTLDIPPVQRDVACRLLPQPRPSPGKKGVR